MKLKQWQNIFHSGCECRFNRTACNSEQKSHNKICQCECKNYHHKCKKDYCWNPSTSTWENSKHLKVIADTSVTGWNYNRYGYCINKKDKYYSNKKNKYYSNKCFEYCFKKTFLLKSLCVILMTPLEDFDFNNGYKTINISYKL